MKEKMEEPSKIMRRSIHTFLKNYHHATTAATIVLPFSVALLLLSQSSSSSTLHTKLNKLFHEAGFSSSSFGFFNILTFKLSQTLSSFVFTLPFSFTFLLFSKAYIIKLLSNNHSLYHLRLLRTYICISFLLLSANASAFALFFLSFNLLEAFGFTSKSFHIFFSLSSTIIYSIILSNTLVITNLALVSSPYSSSGGYTTILKACLLIQVRTSTALALALPMNLGLAGVEALFQYRVVRSYYKGERDITSIAIEGTLIAYLYALILVLDTIVNCVFYQSCVKNDDDQKICREDEFSIKIQICETENTKIRVTRSNGFQEVL